MGKRLTPREFITKANKIHNDKYGYSDIKYVYSSEKVNIKCREHGLFKQVPFNHLRGQLILLTQKAKNTNFIKEIGLSSKSPNLGSLSIFKKNLYLLQ